MLVIACNTISALCTELLRERHPEIIVVDIITPTVNHLTAKQHDKAIGIIATKGHQVEFVVKARLIVQVRLLQAP